MFYFLENQNLTFFLFSEQFSSTSEAQPDAVEVFIDACEDISKELLVKVVNLLDVNVSCFSLIHETENTTDSW
jgi:hypothetical protein